MPAFDLICLSHLRWDFVFQRPQQLLTRCAKEHRVFYVEEPIYDSTCTYLDVTVRGNIHVITAHVPPETEPDVADTVQESLLAEIFERFDLENHVLWYYTPMALPFTRYLRPLATVYDCMDELSAFRGAPRTMQQREQELLARADLVFTGGQSLYEVKRELHPSVHPFPSSVDVAHFAAARTSAGTGGSGADPRAEARLLRCVG